LRLEPSFTETYVLLGSLYLQQNREREAQEMFERVLELEPQNAEAMASLALVHGRNNRWEDAIACYKEALKNDARSSVLHKGLAQAYFELGNHNAALKEIKKALQIDPCLVDGYVLMGRIYHARGLGVQARNAWKKALDLKPDCEEAQECLLVVTRRDNRVSNKK